MSPSERERIAELGRARGAELAHTVAQKTASLKTLGWPAAIRLAQQGKAA